MHHADSQEDQTLRSTTTAGGGTAEARAAVVVARGASVQPAAGLDSGGDPGERGTGGAGDRGGAGEGGKALTPMAPADFGVIARQVVQAKDRNARAKLASRMLDAYTRLFYAALEAQEQAERVAAASQTLAQMGQTLIDMGVTGLPDPAVPLSLEDQA